MNTDLVTEHTNQQPIPYTYQHKGPTRYSQGLSEEETFTLQKVCPHVIDAVFIDIAHELHPLIIATIIFRHTKLLQTKHVQFSSEKVIILGYKTTLRVLFCQKK